MLSVFLPQAAPGQVMSARVDGVLPDGSFRVVVAGQEMSMALPKYFSPGDTLDLVFLGREPRLTFALTGSAQTPSSPAPVVSAAGRTVTSVLPRPGEAAMAPTALSAPPLAAGAPVDTAALSAKLASTLTQSGLFYESHQAEWVDGKRDLAQLLREPQARLEAQARPDAQTRADMPTRPDAQTRAGSSALQQAAQAQQTTAAQAAPNPATGIAKSNDLNVSLSSLRGEQAMPQQAQALVQQQLAALETGKLVFQLQVWPDQWMRWEIDEEEQRSGAETADAEAQQRFQSRLHLALPRLGELDATITFDASGVHVRLNAAQAASAEVLQDNRASLRAALAEAGMSAVDIAVARHGST